MSNHPCECGNAPQKPEDINGTTEHSAKSKVCTDLVDDDTCDGYACTYGCGACYCPCH